jgi:cytochrome c7-like protein
LNKKKGKEVHMRKESVCLLAVAVFVFFGVFSTVHGENEDKGAQVIVIEKGRMPQVTFPHHLHQKTLENDCNACHDMFPKQPGVIKELITQKKLRNQQVMNSKCVRCHKEKKAAGEKAGPVKCAQCHVRPK